VRVCESVLLACAATLLVLVAPVSALELGEWIPGLKLSPFFTEQIDYESNVFQVPSHAQGSTILHEIPGFVAEYTFGNHSLTAGGRADFLNYVALPAQNTINYAGMTNLRLEFNRLLLTFHDDVVRTTEPPNTELTGPIVSLTNTLSTTAEYRLTNRFSAGAGFQWLRPFYPSQPPNQQVGVDLNRNDYIGTGSVFWHFVPTASLGLNATYSREVFTLSPDRDVSNYGMTLSLHGDVTAKLSSDLRLGFIDRVPDTTSQPSYFGVIAGGGVTYRPTERITIALLVDRTPVESTFNNVPFYATLGGTLNVSYLLTPKLTLIARAGGGVNKYPEKQETESGQFDWRQDIFYTYGIGASYAIQRWLNVGVDYHYTGRNSNFSQFEFVDNKVTLRVTLQF
jgi:opacity protein-like surface antigen